MTRSIYLRPWRIDVTVRDRVTSPVPVAVLARAMARAAAAAGAPSPASIGLILSDDSELASLNAAHLGKAGPTDVLSFPLLPPDAFPPHAGAAAPATGSSRVPVFPHAAGPPPDLGDVVISVERAIGQAEEGRGGQTGDVRWAAADELRLLATHGTLHLCGWDHAEPAEEAAMRAIEARLLGEGGH